MKIKKLYLDLETFSETPIKNGTYRYAEDAEIMLFAYAIDDEPAQVLDLTDATNREKLRADRATHGKELIYNLMEAADTLIAHNSMFDRSVLNYNGYIYPVEKWRDTMVKAFIHSMVGSLDHLCKLLGVSADKSKDKEGKALIRLFCQPQKDGSRNTSQTHPEEWARFVEYARLDVEAMREVDRKLPEWNVKSEQYHWELDQKINDRGFQVDVDLVNSALTAIDIAKEDLKDESMALTGGEVESTTQNKVLLEYILSEYGVALPNLQKATLERRINDQSIPDGVRDLLSVRLQASTTSTSKYTALARSVNEDGRLRGTLQFAGAQRTGRWAGRTFQPQNLPRPVFSNETIDAGIEALKLGAAEMLGYNIMELTSSALRGCIVAPEGKKFCVSDLSNIEGRAQAWLADETWKLQAFAAFDEGRGHDLYKLAYAKSFGIRPEDVTKDQRQIGKVQELALGYGGGVGAFVTFAEVYGIELDDLADDAWDTLPEKLKNEAISFLAYLKTQGKAPKMSDRSFITCDTLKRMWRLAHPNISSMWKELEVACINATVSPNATFRVGTLAIRRTGNWLRIRLPNGRYLCYPAVRIHGGSLQYKGMNSMTRKWQYLDTYGGKLFENICQALSRDILADNMHTIENSCYHIILSIHDELICEVPDTDEFSDSELSSLLATVPTWAAGIPLAADGFETYRYRKD